MNNKAHLVPESPAGWTIGFARVPEDGEEPELEGFLTHFESDYPDEKWLMLFRTRQDARTYIAAKLPAEELEDFRWACVEFAALDLLEILREYPELEGVLFDLGSDGTHFVPANVLLEVLERHLGEQEGDAA